MQWNYLKSLSSISGNVRYSSSTKSTKDDLVVFKTRKSFRPLITVGRTSYEREIKQKKTQLFFLLLLLQFCEKSVYFFSFFGLSSSTLISIICCISYFASIYKKHTKPIWPVEMEKQYTIISLCINWTIRVHKSWYGYDFRIQIYFKIPIYRIQNEKKKNTTAITLDVQNDYTTKKMGKNAKTKNCI